MKSLLLVVCLVATSVFAGVAQEVGPVEVVDVSLAILPIGDATMPAIARGVIELVEGCGFCYLHGVQYRISVPESVGRLVIELENLDDPSGDLDLMIREGEPVTEDETSYYYTVRSYGDSGEERLDLPGEDLLVVPPGEYYLAVVSYVEGGAAFELRAAAYVEEILPEPNVLTADTSISDTLQAMSLSGDLKEQFAVDVPKRVEYLLVHAWTDGGAIDVFISDQAIHYDDRSEVAATHRLIASEGDVLWVVQDPLPGRYFIVIGNPTASAVRYGLEAYPLPDVSVLTNAAAQPGTVGWEVDAPSFVTDRLRTEDGMLGLTQYRVDLPAGLEAVRVRLGGEEARDIGLHLRYGRPVSAANGVVLADLSIVEGVEKEVVLRDNLIRSDVLYIAVELLENGEKAFSIEVEVTPAGMSDEP